MLNCSICQLIDFLLFNLKARGTTASFANAAAFQLKAGAYTVQVQDANLCVSQTEDFTIDEVPGIGLSYICIFIIYILIFIICSFGCNSHSNKASKL